MKYSISYIRNSVPQGIIVEASSAEVAERFFAKRKPDAEICGVVEAKSHDIKPGISVLTVNEMTHNEYQEFLKKNASRLYNDKDYTMADYKKDADSVFILDFDLEKFGLTDDMKKCINIMFDAESVNNNGNMRLSGHVMNNDYYWTIAHNLGCEVVCDNYYNGFLKNDEAQVVFSFCEGDISLILCETKEAYLDEVRDYCEFYKISMESVYTFVDGSFNIFVDGHFETKAFNENDLETFVMSLVKENPKVNLSVTKDWNDGYKNTFVDITSGVLRTVNEQLHALKNEACIEVYFDGVHMDSVYVPMDKADEMISSLVQHGYDNYNVDVKEDWERDGGRKNPDLSFKVVAVENVLDKVIENAKEKSSLTENGVGNDKGRDTVDYVKE